MEKKKKITAEQGAHRHRSSDAREPRRVVDGSTEDPFWPRKNPAFVGNAYVEKDELE